MRSQFVVFVKAVLILAMCLALGGAASAASVALAWYPSPDTNVVGYALYYGTSSGNYSARLDVQSQLATSISNLVAGTTYYFVVTAYTAEQLESLPSDEVAYLAPGLVMISSLPAGGVLQVRFSVSPGPTWTLQASENLIEWTNIFQILAISNAWIEVSDPLLGQRPRRFYRAVSVPSLP